jgi:hypothetical protein
MLGQENERIWTMRWVVEGGNANYRVRSMIPVGIGRQSNLDSESHRNLIISKDNSPRSVMIARDIFYTIQNLSVGVPRATYPLPILVQIDIDFLCKDVTNDLLALFQGRRLGVCLNLRSGSPKRRRVFLKVGCENTVVSEVYRIYQSRRPLE